MSLVDRLRRVAAGDDYLDGELDDLIYDDESDDLDTRKKYKYKGPRSVRKAKVAAKKAQRKAQGFTKAKINRLQDAIRTKAASGKIPFGPETPGVGGFRNAVGYAANPLVQSTIYAPFILGGMEMAHDALRTDRGRAFTQNVTAGNYGEAARQLTGNYQYGDVTRIPVDLDGMLAPLAKEPSVEALKALIVKNPSLLNKVDSGTPSTEASEAIAQLSRTPLRTATEEKASMAPPNGPSNQPKATPGLQPGINPRTGLPYTISPGKPGFEPGTEISDGNPQPLVSKAERLAQERETFGLTPMQQWAMHNDKLAQKVGENQSGYNEIDAYFAAQDSGPVGEDLPGRTPADMLAIREGGQYWDSNMPITGRGSSAPIPNDLMEQKGTSMSFASIALPGTPEGLSQIFLTPGQVQMPDANPNIFIDDFYGAGNLVADGLDMERFLPFPNIETEPELNRIINTYRRKK